MILPLDIHSHKKRQGESVLGYSVWSFSYPFLDLQDDHWHSLGIHPMDDTAFTDEALSLLAEKASHPNCLMIGESGLDKRSSVPLSVQMEYLRSQALLSEKLKKPLVVHVVQRMGELIETKRLLRPSQPWLVHGFRGKPEMAQQLLREGFFLSFGEHFNEASLAQVPMERLFLETDESSLPFEQILRNAASVRGVSFELLRESLEKNVRAMFPSVEGLFNP